MQTYQDLLNVGANDIKRGEFCKMAVEQFKSTENYKNAYAGELYYAKRNVTIEKFKKFITTISGQKREDMFSANYKLKSLIFRRFVIQQVQYVLGNGLKLEEPENKKKLGKDFDYKLQLAAKRALVCGTGFGFWNLDHLEVFGYCETDTSPGFCPLYSEDTAELLAGIRFWTRKVGDINVFRCTLYEADGYTEFIKSGDKDIEIHTPKRGYIKTTVATEAGGVESESYSNYTFGLPIVPLYGNDLHESELNGLRENIDCYDYIKSGFANDIDDTPGIYWAIKNAGGMDDADLARFVQRMRTVRAATVDDDQDIEAHTLDIPVEARSKMLELLRADLYEDFQALDVKSLSASQKTTQEIQAAYQAQDNKCADFEYHVLQFVDKILMFAGITDEEASFTWNKVVNMTEQTNMILMASNYLSDEMVLKKLPFLTPEEIEEETAKLTERNAQQFNANPAEGDNDLIDELGDDE